MKQPDDPPQPARIIRQNPAVASGDKPTGLQDCAIHGSYPTPPEVGDLRRRATEGPGMSASRARSLLDASEQLRRTCPQCRGPAATYVDLLRARRQAEGGAE